MSDRTGLLDRYHLIRKLGSGAFGKVYLAKDRYRHNDVAIKILPSLADDELPKFLTEARMMRLKHPHVIQILDFGIEQQTPFLVMEYAPCGDLRQRHPKGSCVSFPTILSYVTQLASALQAAHDDQIIHRDVKPENMLLNQQGQVLLSDFGIAMMVHSSTLHSAQSFFVGTVPYMAPEQAEGHQLTGKLPSVATANASTTQFPATPIQSTTPQQDNTGPVRIWLMMLVVRKCTHRLCSRGKPLAIWGRAIRWRVQLPPSRE